MSETSDIDRIITALKKVGKKNLLIIELINKVSSEGGQLDNDELADIQPEVNLAVAEAKTYGAHTMIAVNTLKRLHTPEEEEDV